MQRLFIIAPSLARLIQKERGGERVLEGYFPDQPHRRTDVQVEETRSSLILEADEGAVSDEQADCLWLMLKPCWLSAMVRWSTCGPSCPSAHTRSRLFTSSDRLLLIWLR